MQILLLDLHQPVSKIVGFFLSEGEKQWEKED